MTRAQQARARRNAEAKATVPELVLEVEVEVGADSGARVVRACALALREHPDVNGAYRDGRVEGYERVNIGFEVSSGDGAVATPTIFDADAKSTQQIADEMGVLRGRAQDGSITAPESAGATFTVCDLSAQGVSRFAAIISPPQAAILGVGCRALSLTCDSRALDGVTAGAFLTRVRDALESER